MIKKPIYMSMLITTGAVYATTLTTVAASPVEFDLTFYDQSESLAGTGTFTVRGLGGRCVELKAYDDCETKSRGPDRQRFVTNDLSQFSARIGAEQWLNNPDQVIWWSDSSGGAGEQRSNRGVFEGTSDYWQFGDINLGTRTLHMTFDRTTPNTGFGTWEQLVITPETPVPQRRHGHWVAAVRATP